MTAVKFRCFITTGSDRNVFDLLILTPQDSNSIRVTKSIPISFHPSSEQCDSSDSSKCCDTITLPEQDQFISKFLIEMVNVETPNLAAPFRSLYSRFETTLYKLSLGRPTANSMLTLTRAITLPLHLMWFHISKQLKIIHFNLSNFINGSICQLKRDRHVTTFMHLLNSMQHFGFKHSYPR